MTTQTTDFGFQTIAASEKTARVGEVFERVAPYYDRMNTIMSGGLHHLWKAAAARLLDVRPGMKTLDLAAGSGDMAAHLARAAGAGNVMLSDINPAMLAAARRRLPDAAAAIANGENLPFAARSFDRAVIAFGLRNVTHRDRLLRELRRVLKTGGKYGILEFSPTAHFRRAHRAYLTAGLPLLGRVFANDSESYRYLGESILRFLPPEELRALLAQCGLPDARINRFAAGAVCLHHGRRYD